MSDFVFAEDILSAVSREECAKLAQLARGKTVVELGSYFGRSTIALASVASVVHAIDWHKGDVHSGATDTLQVFLANLSRYGVREKVMVHVGRNDEIVPQLPREGFDLAFIDSFHEEKAVEADALLARPLVKRGGFLAFHDYGVVASRDGVPFGVTSAVDAFVKREKLPLQVVRTLAVVRLPV